MSLRQMAKAREKNRVTRPISHSLTWGTKDDFDIMVDPKGRATTQIEQEAAEALVLLRQGLQHHSNEFFYSKSASQGIVLGRDPDWRKYLSAFCPSVIHIDNNTFPCVENAFHRYKWLCSTRPDLAADNRYVVGGQFDGSPQQAKSSTGKGAMKKIQVVLDIPRWNLDRIRVMRRLLQARFNQDAHFREILLEAKQRHIRLLHFERGDNSFWGCKQRKGTEEIVGENLFGKFLMQLTL